MFLKVGKISDIPLDKGLNIEHGDQVIGVFNSNGKIYAMDNLCPHHGALLSEGDFDGKIAICPWHGWRFNVTSGQCLGIPSEILKTYPVKIENDEVFITVEAENPKPDH